MGLRQRTVQALVARRIRPATSIPRLDPHSCFICCMQRLLHAGHDATYRNSCDSLPACRGSEFLAAAFARNRRFRDLLASARSEEQAAGRMGCMPSLLGARFLSTFPTPCCFIFGYRWGRGQTPSPAPPCSDASGATAFHSAAHYGDRRSVRKLIGASARRRRRPRQRQRAGLSVRHPTQRPTAAESRRLMCRSTPLHLAACYGKTEARATVAIKNRFGMT
jgi:hypothetical protein